MNYVTEKLRIEPRSALCTEKIDLPSYNLQLRLCCSNSLLLNIYIYMYIVIFDM